MARQSAGCVLLGLVALLAGCRQPERFRSQELGPVEFEHAWPAALNVMSQHYRLESIDRQQGRIVSRPTAVQQPRDLRLSATPARELATMRLRQEGQTLWADVRVETQRQDAAAAAALSRLDQTRDVPNYTPAAEDAPLTPQQTQLWRTTGYNYERERAILMDLHRRLHPEDRPNRFAAEQENSGAAEQ